MFIGHLYTKLLKMYIFILNNFFILNKKAKSAQSLIFDNGSDKHFYLEKRDIFFNIL